MIVRSGRVRTSMFPDAYSSVKGGGTGGRHHAVEDAADFVTVFGVFRICSSLLSQSIKFQKKFSFHFHEVDKPKLFFCPFFYWEFFIRITSVSILFCITV